MIIGSAEKRKWYADVRNVDAPPSVQADAPAKLAIRPEPVRKFLITALVLLGGADIITQTINATLSPSFPGWVQLEKLFNLDREFSFPTWYSIILLASAALLLGLIAWAAYRERDVMWKYWGALAAIFTGLSIDEQVLGHESVGQAVGEQITSGGIFFYAWVVPGAIAVAILGLIFIPFLRYLPRRTRVSFVIAAALYLGGALVMEMLSGIVADNEEIDNLFYATMTSIEEILEILGASFFILTLLSEVERRLPGLSISFESRHDAPGAS